MWCAACQQDVPALQGTGRNESRCCIRCRQPFHRTHHVQHADKDAFADSQSPFKAKALPE
ncbi:MAG: hypothetical protein RIS70_129, partial [Planctomycetota bacterium]